MPESAPECLICAGTCSFCGGAIEVWNLDHPHRVGWPAPRVCADCGSSYSPPVPQDGGAHAHTVVKPDKEHSGEYLFQDGQWEYRIGDGDWVKGKPPEWLLGPEEQMDLDFLDHETFRVLEDGFAGPPVDLERSKTALFAVTIREPYAGLLFIRRLGPDDWDSECTVAKHRENGTWTIDGFSGSSFLNPFERPEDGWDGDPIVWSGGLGADIGDEGDEEFVQAVGGLASPRVAQLEVYDQRGDLFDVVRIRDDTGVFVVILVGEGPHTVIALDRSGTVIRDGDGQEVREIFDRLEDPFGGIHSFGPDDDEDQPIMGEIGKDDQGRWFVGSEDAGRELVTDPEAIGRLERQFGSDRSSWPRRASRE